ncbi:MAG TPA: hypothetical protein VFS59_08330, partial [Gemmatimonadaceae bacterium]|nr:hypothetical protein [Gemmatimonadaceae bacterium]
MSAARMISPRWGLLSLAAVVSMAGSPRSAAAQTFHLERLRTEHATNPIGIDEPAPRLSWTLHADRRGTRQS